MIFLSYARDDRDRVAPLAQALIDEGWDVWWDRKITPGQTYDEVIQQAIDDASAVVCVWTKKSVTSSWVKSEADEGMCRHILIPISLDDVRVPLAFRQIQSADLTDWTPGTNHGGFNVLIGALVKLVGHGASKVTPPQRTEPEPAAKLPPEPGDHYTQPPTAPQPALAAPAEQEHSELEAPHRSKAEPAAASSATPQPAKPSLKHRDRQPARAQFIEGGTIPTLGGHTGPVHACAVAPDNSYIVSASADKTLRIWDPTTGKAIRTLEGHTDWVQGCAVASDNSYIVSASADRKLRIWDPTTGKAIRALKGHAAEVRGCAVAPDNSYIVSASADRKLRIWDPTTGKAIRALKGHAAEVRGCAVAPDNSYIVSASADRKLRIWDPGTGDTIRTINTIPTRKRRASLMLSALVPTGSDGFDAVNGCAVAPDNSYIVTASANGMLRIWDPGTGDTIRTLIGHTSEVWGCAVAPDNSYIVSASADRTLRIWDPGTGDTIRTLIGHTSEVWGCAVAPDNSYIVSASADRTLRIWR